MSACEIAKRAGSTGAASGGSPIRRRSQARNSCRSRRSAAFSPAWKNRSRCCGVSLAQPCIVVSNRSACRISQSFKTRIQQTKHKNQKTQICSGLAVARRRVTCPKGPGDRLLGVRASASSLRQSRPRCPLTRQSGRPTGPASCDRLLVALSTMPLRLRRWPAAPWQPGPAGCASMSTSCIRVRREPALLSEGGPCNGRRRDFARRTRPLVLAS